MASLAWLFKDSKGTTHGPVDIEIIKKKYKIKEINDDSFVCNENTFGKWICLKNAIEFDDIRGINCEYKDELDYDTMKNLIDLKLSKVWLFLSSWIMNLGCFDCVHVCV